MRVSVLELTRKTLKSCTRRCI
ncbi:hypothetical protein Ccrd_026612 [Cynara cardunculus var. scolymus]|uniref:Uncharacterized protein n=1 Tax=Cynara cardunculus var. scolymus TaxID=59895 RepID=A0A103MHM1_CYNCS|nr:hypothetical protein Ccrd_026612 [Cynara cardunculus var. scolymus]